MKSQIKMRSPGWTQQLQQCTVWGHTGWHLLPWADPCNMCEMECWSERPRSRASVKSRERGWQNELDLYPVFGTGLLRVGPIVVHRAPWNRSLELYRLVSRLVQLSLLTVSTLASQGSVPVLRFRACPVTGWWLCPWCYLYYDETNFC